VADCSLSDLAESALAKKRPQRSAVAVLPVDAN
jgi:hypothetical protein